MYANKSLNLVFPLFVCAFSPGWYGYIYIYCITIVLIYPCLLYCSVCLVLMVLILLNVSIWVP